MEFSKDFVGGVSMIACGFALGQFLHDTVSYMLKFLYGVIAALIAISLSGCTLHYSRDQIGFWDQCVKADAYGVSMFTSYGPFNIGKLTWMRNVNCDTDIKQQKPLVPTFPTTP